MSNRRLISNSPPTGFGRDEPKCFGEISLGEFPSLSHRPFAETLNEGSPIGVATLRPPGVAAGLTGGMVQLSRAGQCTRTLFCIL